MQFLWMKWVLVIFFYFGIEWDLYSRFLDGFWKLKPRDLKSHGYFLKVQKFKNSKKGQKTYQKF